MTYIVIWCNELIWELNRLHEHEADELLAILNYCPAEHRITRDIQHTTLQESGT